MAKAQVSTSSQAALRRRQHLAALLNDRHFRRALTELQGRPKDEWSRDERYAAGYALLQSGDPVGALLGWAPLLTKMGPEFDATCRLLAQQVFSDSAALRANWDERTCEELLPFYATARTLLPDHPLTQELRGRVESQLWASGDEASLIILLKLLESSREPLDHATYVNLPRLRWRLRPPRSLADARSLLPAYLTAAASYVLTRGDVCSLGDGLTSLMSILLQELGKSLSCTKEVLAGLATWVSYEVAAIVAVGDDAKAAVPDGVIFAPSHFEQLEAKRTAVFRTHLSTLPAALRAPYESAGQGAELLRVFTGQESAKAERSYLQRGADDPTLAPGLRLALFEHCLRRGDPIAERIISHLLAELPLIKTGLLNCLSAAVRDVIAVNFESPELSAVIAMISGTIARGTTDADLRAAASRFLLHVLWRLNLPSQSEWLALATLTLDLTPSPETRAELQALLDRTRAAEEFLDDMLSNKGMRRINKIIKGKDLAQLKSLLALAVDAGRLTLPWAKAWCLTGDTLADVDADEYEAPVDQYLELLERLLTHSSLLRSAPHLAQQTNPIAAMRCACVDCLMDVLSTGLPNWLSSMGISVARMPRPAAPLLPEASNPVAVGPHLDFDPFAILGVSLRATKSEILAATMQQMRQSPARMAELRSAQAMLFDAKTRVHLEFIRCFADPAASPRAAGAGTRAGASSQPSAQEWKPSQVPLLDGWRRCSATRS